MNRSVTSVALILSTILAAPALAQATRTWVSGVGDDVNPCSRTAPCKTFAGAISKTAAGGEINVIDPGGFGAVTITKSLTIDGHGTQASILSTGTTGINVNGAGIVVNLRNLTINGGNSTVGSGIRIINADSVNVDNVTIFNYAGTGTVGRGVSIESSTPNARVSITNSIFYNLGNVGIAAFPAVGPLLLDVDNVRIFRGADHGIHLGNNTKLTLSRSIVSGHPLGAGVALNLAGASAHISDSVLSNNRFGISSGAGGGTPTTRLFGTVITGNTLDGLRITAGSVFSHGNNAIVGNAGNETPTPPILGTQ
ncbi:MAG TPA: right-handed parallel beta-helix repeat-containing protein [Allosphingosinicella sp.]|jgi:hypothetical protein